MRKLFLILVCAATLTTPQDTALAAGAFSAKWDTDGNGRLSWEEAKVQGVEETKFKKADRNKDGSLNAKEFKSLLKGVSDAPASSYTVNTKLYGDGGSEARKRLENGETLILHRTVHDCVTGKLLPDKMKNQNEEVLKVGKAPGYMNVICASRKKQQCEDDGTPDLYFEEWCETLDGRRL